MLERTCEVCGRVFAIYPSDLKYSSCRFCSFNCYSSWRKSAHNEGKWFPPNKRIYISKDELHRLYWVEKLSANEISKRYRTDASNIIRYMKKYGIPRRTLSECQRLSKGKRAFKKKISISQLKLERRLLDHSIRGLLSQDAIVNYIIKNKEEFGYKEVFLCQTSDFDLIGLKEDGTTERIEVEVQASQYNDHHDKVNCDKVIAYYGTNEKLPVPLIIVDKRTFIPFLEEFYSVQQRYA